jgi:hypothetical protein
MKMPRFRRHVLHHPDFGVCLGSMLGLISWSKINPVGQPSAVTFRSPAEAVDWTETWDSIPDGVTTREVMTLLPDHATMDECMDAGLLGWEDRP